MGRRDSKALENSHYRRIANSCTKPTKNANPIRPRRDGIGRLECTVQCRAGPGSRHVHPNASIWARPGTGQRINFESDAGRLTGNGGGPSYHRRSATKTHSRFTAATKAIPGGAPRELVQRVGLQQRRVRHQSGTPPPACPSPNSILRPWAGPKLGSRSGRSITPVQQVADLRKRAGPDAAASGWVHMSVPIDKTIAGIDPSKGIVFKKWVTEAQKNAAAAQPFGFWVDNVILKGSQAAPPPSLSMGEKPVTGLAFVAASGGNGIARTFERWVMGIPGSEHPDRSTTLSRSRSIPERTIPDLSSIYILCRAHPMRTRSDPDWHEPNVLIYSLGNDANGGM